MLQSPISTSKQMSLWVQAQMALDVIDWFNLRRLNQSCPVKNAQTLYDWGGYRKNRKVREVGKIHMYEYNHLECVARHRGYVWVGNL